MVGAALNVIGWLFLGAGVWAAVYSAVCWFDFFLKRAILLRYIREHPTEGLDQEMVECRRKLFKDGYSGCGFLMAVPVLLGIGILIRWAS